MEVSYGKKKRGRNFLIYTVGRLYMRGGHLNHEARPSGVSARSSKLTACIGYDKICNCWDTAKPGLWTLDWTVDWTMDWTGDDHYRFSGDYLGYVQPTEPLNEDSESTLQCLWSSYS